MVKNPYYTIHWQGLEFEIRKRLKREEEEEERTKLKTR